MKMKKISRGAFLPTCSKNHMHPTMICMDAAHALLGKYNFTLVPIVPNGRDH